MLKVAIITISFAFLAFGRPQSEPSSSPSSNSTNSQNSSGNSNSSVTFLKNERQPLDGHGSYKYDIELSDGTKFSQEGNTEAPGAGENETSIVIRGSYSYVSPDGTPVNVMYIANKDGFQPVGNVIPKAGNATASASGPSSSSSSVQGSALASNETTAATAATPTVSEGSSSSTSTAPTPAAPNAS